MEMYIGTKIISAEPMTRGEYAKFSGRIAYLLKKVNLKMTRATE